MAYYIGLMSGTSVDGIDAVICSIDQRSTEDSTTNDNAIQLISSLGYPIPLETQAKIHDISNKHYDSDPIEMMGHLEVEMGQLFSDAVDALLDHAKLDAKDICAIGSHGQTIRHIPNHPQAFTLQIGDANIIAANTGITTVADFRRRDMAYGGQGAPLVPAFHQSVFATQDSNRVIVNLGGIANISVLAQGTEIIGFDTGPANTLLDQWIAKHQSQSYDANGEWASSGNINQPLLDAMLQDTYFAQAAPKSTGREYFNLAWLESFDIASISAVDVQRTLLELTAQSLVNAIQQHLPSGEIYICGGGVHNDFLVERISSLANTFSVNSTLQLGVDPDWVEAMAFAWLAHRTLNQQTGNLASVTGATQDTILGAIYPT